MSQDDPIPGSVVPRLSATFRLQYEQAQQSWVLLYPEGMVKLNPSAAEILQRCDGVRDVATITRELEQAFDEADLSADVAAFVRIARDQHWLVI